MGTEPSRLDLSVDDEEDAGRWALAHDFYSTNPARAGADHILRAVTESPPWWPDNACSHADALIRSAAPL